MKERISASVEKETVEKIDRILGGSVYRNKSHVIEAAIDLLEKEMEGKSNE